MGMVNFNLTDFRTQFPAFSNSSTFPDTTLQLYFNNATLYINNQYGSYCGSMNVSQLTQALYLMTAHLTAISVLIAQNQVVGIMINATVDKVTVGLEPPPAPNQWQYWLQSTPYGQQLLSLLQIVSVGGYFVGGRHELAAFRRPWW